jgi:hypothetical protein
VIAFPTEAEAEVHQLVGEIDNVAQDAAAARQGRQDNRLGHG